MNVDQADCSREQQSEQVKVVGSQTRTIVLHKGLQVLISSGRNEPGANSDLVRGPQPDIFRREGRILPSFLGGAWQVLTHFQGNRICPRGSRASNETRWSERRSAVQRALIRVFRESGLERENLQGCRVRKRGVARGRGAELSTVGRQTALLLQPADWWPAVGPKETSFGA